MSSITLPTGPAQSGTISAAPFTGPSASVVYVPTNRVFLFGLDGNGNIMQWTQNDNGIGYFGPKPIGAKAKPGSDLTAVYTVNAGYVEPAVRVYFLDTNGRYHEWTYLQARGFFDGGILP